ncbi:DsbE family thiol:disulfide interchange protein [Aliagarivorans marinus]|uniref:DsbE family thiol:disulfide interchange protein n=1 Tax=Aliagarivorans marinus TaxID=561965 RepID=UPI000424FA84|nr:DsbE family thiol:disulfide interchange protein [Aliagarivorans marinus]
MNKRLLYFFLPLVVFLAVSVFLFRGLYSDPTELESVLVGKPVPQFELQDIYELDKQHHSNIFEGEPLLLNVWATWCPTCRAEHEFLNTLAEQGVKIIGLNYKDDRGKAINWLAQLGNPYAINLYDEKGLLALDLGVYGAPETYLIDSQGIIRYRHVGDVNARNWQQELAPIFSAME